MTQFTCPAGTHLVIIDHQEYCVPDAHPVPISDTLSLVGLALAILCAAMWRRRT